MQEFDISSQSNCLKSSEIDCNNSIFGAYVSCIHTGKNSVDGRMRTIPTFPAFLGTFSHTVQTLIYISPYDCATLFSCDYVSCCWRRAAKSVSCSLLKALAAANSQNEILAARNRQRELYTSPAETSPRYII